MRAGWLVALALACGPAEPPARGAAGPVREDMAVQPGPKEQVATCDAAGETLGGTEWVPADARLAVVVDGDAPGLPAATARLAAGVADRGLPVVAGLALGQLGLQLTLVRSALGRAGLRPRELALIHDRDGAVIWVLRARCDVKALQATIARAWGVRGRAVAGGEVAEAAPGTGFPHDVVFLSEDRVALVPAGQATAQRRWLEDRAAPPIPSASSAPRPGEVLAEIPPAPIRGVLTGTSLLIGDGAGTLPLVRTIRATAEALEIDGRL